MVLEVLGRVEGLGQKKVGDDTVCVSGVRKGGEEECEGGKAGQDEYVDDGNQGEGGGKKEASTSTSVNGGKWTGRPVLLDPSGIRAGQHMCRTAHSEGPRGTE